jgi:hypothetical protein
MVLDMHPDFYEALQNTVAFASILHSLDHPIASHGKGAYMLKGSSKRKRTHAEVEEVKDEEEELKQDKQTFLKRKKQMT